MSIGYSLDRVLVLVCAGLFSCTVIHAKECGFRPAKLAIVNGTDAYENEFPWQASLRFFNKFTCGGTILSDTWILTAAHCVESYDLKLFKPFSVMIGSLSLTTPSKNEKVINVTRIELYPQRNANTGAYDLALLELAQPIGLNSSVLNAICLGKPEHQTEGISAVISGWGDRSETNHTQIDKLKRATITVEKNETCKEIYYFKDYTDSIVCAGRETSPCFGDSGGPLQYELDGRWYQLGVISGGIKCGSENFPALFTRVPYFLDFIKQITGITPP